MSEFRYVTKEDIVALGYRKKQLGIFSQLLADPDFFELCKKQKSIKGDELLGENISSSNSSRINDYYETFL